MSDLRALVVGLVNAASVSRNPAQELVQAQEIISSRDTALYPEFFEAMLGFSRDKDNRARRFAATFAGNAIRLHGPRYMKQSADCILMLLCDENAGVLKVAIKCSSVFIRRSFSALCAHRGPFPVVLAQQWTTALKLLDVVVAKVSPGSVRSANDGVRTQAIRSLENIVLLFSDVAGTQSTRLTKLSGQCLQSVPSGDSILSRAALRKEGTRVVEVLLKLLTEPSMTASNFQVLVYVLATVVKARVSRAEPVMPHLLQFSLSPPTHITSNSSKSLAKAVKLALGSLAKSTDDVLSRWKEAIADTIVGKAPTLPAAIDVPEDNDGSFQSDNALADENVAHVRGWRLAAQMGNTSTVELVMRSFQTFQPGLPPLPTVQSEQSALANLLSAPVEVNVAAFEAAVRSTESQLRIGAKSAVGSRKRKHEIGVQMSQRKSGPGYDKILKAVQMRDSVLESTVLKATSGSTTHCSAVTAMQVPVVKKKQPAVEAVNSNMSDVQHMRAAAWRRLLAPRCSISMDMCGASALRRTQLAKIAVEQEVGAEFHKLLLVHVVENFADGHDLATDWLYHEFSRSVHPERASRYNVVLLLILKAISDGGGAGGFASTVDRLEALILECPQVTTGAIELLMAWCTDYSKVKGGLKLLKELVVHRPSVRQLATEALLSFTTHAEVSIRDPAIRIVVSRLFELPTSKDVVRAHALACLNSLVTQRGIKWTVSTKDGLSEEGAIEDIVQCRTQLYFALCTKEHRLLIRVMEVFVISSLAVKKAILGRSHLTWASISQEEDGRAVLKQMLHTFPAKEGLPYILKMLHVLSKNHAPLTIIDEVKNVYHERVQDSTRFAQNLCLHIRVYEWSTCVCPVRLLTPFLYAHTAEELMAMLPELVALLVQNQGSKIFKNALTQLFSASPCPLLPADFLIALHALPLVSLRQRQVASAISTCICDLALVFNSATLAKVLSRLVERAPLPPLFMYTVITSIKKNPKLITTSLVQVLKRCVDKKIWLHTPSSSKILWKGFARCVKDCAHHDQIIAILRSLPQKQLVMLLQDSQLHAAFTAHMSKFDHPAMRYLDALNMTKPLPGAVDEVQPLADDEKQAGSNGETTEITL